VHQTHPQRRLAAILVADVVGYSRLMGQDESGTLRRIKAIRREVVDPNIAAYHGRVVKTTGDGILIEYPSAVEAVGSAVAVQRAMAERNADIPVDQRIEFRIGVHQGDIVVDDQDIFGDGVNVAARLETLSAPGGICISGRVYEDMPVDWSFHSRIAASSNSKTSRVRSASTRSERKQLLDCRPRQLWRRRIRATTALRGGWERSSPRPRQLNLCAGSCCCRLRLRSLALAPGK
jgi:class 3 adenylate cyclase